MRGQKEAPNHTICLCELTFRGNILKEAMQNTEHENEHYARDQTNIWASQANDRY